jgi:hypothetical protein
MSNRFKGIGQQYFDDAGDPVIDGKLYFYESGTIVDKVVYFDVNLSIPHAQPVELTAAGRQPPIFFSGTANVILTHQGGQIEVSDPEGGAASETSFPAWNGSTIWDFGDIVVGSDGNYYVSIIANNQASDPTSTPAAWTQIRFIRVWNTNESYEPLVIVEASDGLLYTGVTSSNTGNNPIGDLTNWKPSIEATVPDIIEAAARSYAYNNF